MDFQLSRQQELFRKMVREFAEREIAPHILWMEENREVVPGLLQKMGKQGLIGVIHAREYGGTAMGHLARMLMIEELARVYPPLGGFFQGDHLASYVMEKFGTPEQKQKYLPGLIRGETISCCAVTEPTGGSDPANMQTTARPEGDSYVLNGRKVFISLAGIADIALVLAKTDNKYSAFIVEKDTPGYSLPRREMHAGFKALPVNEVVFADCRIPRENLVGQEGKGMGTALTTIVEMGRTGAVGVALGGAQGCLDASIKFAKERKLYGQPIAELQGIQFMLAEMQIAVEACRWMAYRVAWLLDQGLSGPEAAAEVGKAKVFCCDQAIDVALKAIQIHGAYGTTPEYQIASKLHDIIELYSAGGTQQVQKVTIAGAILK